MYYLGQFEKSLLVWTKADRLRRNNKEVFCYFEVLSSKLEQGTKSPKDTKDMKDKKETIVTKDDNDKK